MPAGDPPLTMDRHDESPTMNKPLATETLKQLRIIIAAVRQHFRALEAACGVSGAQVWILSAIAETPGITVSRLSEALAVHISTASNMLDKLVAASLVQRERSDTDRRVVHLRLTPQGEAAIGRAPRPLAGLVSHALEAMPEEALARLHDDLDTLIRHMNPVDHSAANKPLSTLVR